MGKYTIPTTYDKTADEVIAEFDRATVAIERFVDTMRCSHRAASFRCQRIAGHKGRHLIEWESDTLR